MEGRFRKIDASQYSFSEGGGIYCNNEDQDILLQILKEKFGKPNGNSLRADDSTWKYVFEYQNAYIAIYDFGHCWSLGFLELENLVPDYELIYAVCRMLFDFLKQQVGAYRQEMQIA